MKAMLISLAVIGVCGGGCAEKTLPVAEPVGDPIKNSIGMVLVPIPAGEFMMGSPESESDREDDELQHRVTITRSFYLGRTEVTQGQWIAVMGTTPWKDEPVVNRTKRHDGHRGDISADAVVNLGKISTERLLNVAEPKRVISFLESSTILRGNDETLRIDREVPGAKGSLATSGWSVAVLPRARFEGFKPRLHVVELERDLIVAEPMPLNFISSLSHLESPGLIARDTRIFLGGVSESGDYPVTSGDYPATHVSWEDAVEFCRKLTEHEGVDYRLPTEAEWEYACRAGTTTAYSFRDDTSRLGEYAWYTKNLDDAGEKDARTVSQKKPNPWGLFDMHGNMFEWCQDWAGDYPSGDVTDPVGPSTGPFRTGRGGSCGYGPGQCRSASRGGDASSDRAPYMGFRVVRRYVE